jgi:methionine--tRNA ligase beta chain
VAGPASTSPADRSDPAAEGRLLSLADFRRAVLRVGTILAAEPIPGTDRLLAVTVDLGAEQRQVVAGIAQAYTPRQLHGLQVVVVTNLAPATIRGIKSHGMLLGVGCDDPAAVALLTISRPVRNGSAVI